MTSRRSLFDDEPEVQRRPTKREAHRRVLANHAEMLGTADVDQLSSNRLVPFYLMASLAYYELNDNFMDDAAYDHICRRLQAEWEEVRHPHKALVKFDSLDATTGYSLNFRKLPTIIRVATRQLLDGARAGTLRRSLQRTQRKALL